MNPVYQANKNFENQIRYAELRRRPLLERIDKLMIALDKFDQYTALLEEVDPEIAVDIVLGYRHPEHT